MERDGSGFRRRTELYPAIPSAARTALPAPAADSVYDENYRTDTDTSPVLCEGSAFIGPQALPDRIAPPIGLNPWQRAEYLRWLAAYNQTPIHRAQRLMRNMLDSLAAIMGMTPLTIDPPAGNPETSE